MEKLGQCYNRQIAFDLYYNTNMHVAGSPGSCVGGEPGMMPIYSLVPRPLSSFLSLAVRLCGRRPGTFSHMSDFTGRKTVERLELNVGERNYNVALCLHCFALVNSFCPKRLEMA